MIIFIDESGDLGWSFDKPRRRGGSSRFITITGVAFEKHNAKLIARFVNDLCLKCGFTPSEEIKGSQIEGHKATLIVKDIIAFNQLLSIISITADKRNVPLQLRRDKNIFYNHMLNILLSDSLYANDEIEIILDNRTIRSGSRNSFEDCLRAKCWGELQLNTNISCRYEDSHKNPGIWIADWLSNFIWRHYERNISDAYHQCIKSAHFNEKKLFT